MNQPFISYAQNGEDIMLWRALGSVERGFYLDVGAQDPEVDSVTKAFYDRGWHGINLEPVAHWYERLLAERPHDLNLRMAASNRSGTLSLFEIDDSGLSTANPEFAKHHAEKGFHARAVEVPCTTLDDVCAQHAVGTVHFLKVDCEGAEREVLEGMSFDRVRPWVVLVEATEPLSTRPSWQEWDGLLTGRRYDYVYTDGVNRYYVAAEHPELRDAFKTPPNALDGARRAAEVRYEREVVHLNGEVERLAAAEALGRVSALNDQLASLQASHREATAEIRRSRDAELRARDAELRARDADVLARDAVIAAGHAEREGLRADLERRDVELAGARASHAGWSEEIDVRQTAFAALVQERDALRTELARHRTELQHTQAEAGRLQRELVAVYHSSSWRLSAPVRIIGRLTRRLKGRTARSGQA